MAIMNNFGALLTPKEKFQELLKQPKQKKEQTTKKPEQKAYLLTNRKVNNV